MSRIPTTDDERTFRADVRRRLDDLERMGTLGAAACRAGVTQWQDAGGTVQIQVGLDPVDGVYEVKIGTGGTQLKLVASGPNAGQILGLVISSIAGALSVGGLLSANGGLSVPSHNGSTNVPETPSANGCDIWIQSTDPGASAANGDLWVNG